MKRLLFASVVFFFTLLLFSFHMITSYGFDIDMGRDLLDISRIMGGDITLVGPKLSFGGYFSGPYYYYLFAPFLWIARGNVSGLLYANAVLFAVSMAGVFYVLSREYGIARAAAATLWVASTAYMIVAARHPGNALTYIGPLFLWIVAFLSTKCSRPGWFGCMGLAAGVLLNFHPVACIAIGPIFLLRLVRKDMTRNNAGALILGTAVSYAPLILFELTHGFIMTKNTFVSESYRSFVASQNVARASEVSSNPILNIPFISTFMTGWITPPILVLSGLITILGSVIKRKDVRIVTIIYLATLFCVAVVFRYQVSFHYLLPFLVFLQVVLIYQSSALSGKVFSGIFILLFVANIAGFPRGYYAVSTRRFDAMRDTLSRATPLTASARSDLNVIALRENPITVPAADYRYILGSLGYQIRTDTEYAQSKYLLVVQEDRSKNPRESDSWEMRQFGPKKLVGTKEADGIGFFLYRK